MKIIKKTVYYCDFCKKRSLRSLKVHEAHCTGNPDRSCRLCEMGRDYRTLVAKLPFTTDKECEFGENIGVKSAELMDLVDGCPACALTILRLFMRTKSPDTYLFQSDFSFKKELDAWWDAKNDDQARADYGYRD